MSDPSASTIGQQIEEALGFGWTKAKVENYIDALEPRKDWIDGAAVPWLLHRYVMHRVGHAAFTGGISLECVTKLYDALPDGSQSDLAWPTDTQPADATRRYPKD